MLILLAYILNGKLKFHLLCTVESKNILVHICMMGMKTVSRELLQN